MLLLTEDGDARFNYLRLGRVVSGYGDWINGDGPEEVVDVSARCFADLRDKLGKGSVSCVRASAYFR